MASSYMDFNFTDPLDFGVGRSSFAPRDTSVMAAFGPKDTGFSLDSLSVIPGAAPATAGGGFDWSKLLGKDTLSGVGSVMQGLANLGAMYTASKQLGLQKDAFNFQKEAFNRNYNMQRDTLNERYRANHAARASADPDRYNMTYGQNAFQVG